ncbi:sulfatase [Rubripirellula obstinata]|nr:sulfatase [Rubripirellula obstinata]
MNSTIKRIQNFFHCMLVPVAVFSLLPFAFTCEANAAESKPNVVFILADDLGFSDTTLFGTTKFYRTPNMERLAARGMLFSRAYSSSPLCSPTRSSILTGLSPARTEITAPVCHVPAVSIKATPGVGAPPNKKAILPKSATRFKTDHYTLAEMFRDNGYATAHFGKWHLGPEPYSPLQHGFDIDIPHWPGPGPAGNYVAPWRYVDFDPQTPNEHIEDRMAEEAVAYMEDHVDEPFFLNYWMFSVHAPFNAKQELIDDYKTRVDPNDPQRSPTYAAMVESMDDAVGTLLDALDRLKLADNTIIVFASDNGGNMYNEVDGTTATSNAPLKGGKATMYEGGVRGPGIVVYPGVVQASSKSDEVIQSSDYYPTLLELLSIDAQPDQSFDGISIVPALQGGELDREAIYTFFPHSPGIPDWLPPAVSVHRSNESGDWKLIRLFYNGENGKHRYKLFNLKEDVGESKDVSAEHPEMVRELDAMIEEFLVDTGAVLPRPNPKFDPSKYDPSKEGKASLKGGANKKPAKQKGPPAKPVAGWQPQGPCKLSLADGNLLVHSSGGDPHFVYSLPDSAVAKSSAERDLILRFSMTSDSNGQGQVFWSERGSRPAYIGKRSVKFDVEHDGESHQYAIPFSSKQPVVGIRLDPSEAKGKLLICDMTLTTSDGEVLYAWSF